MGVHKSQLTWKVSIKQTYRLIGSNVLLDFDQVVISPMIILKFLIRSIPPTHHPIVPIVEKSSKFTQEMKIIPLRFLSRQIIYKRVGDFMSMMFSTIKTRLMSINV